MEMHYSAKEESYFSNVREEILPMIPPTFSRIFELGCGDGSTLNFVRSKFPNAKYFAGIDIEEKAIAKARQRLDFALCANIENIELPNEISGMDVILCLDVLEHLVDPWNIVKRLHDRLSDSGVIVASIPNIRYFRASLPLVFAGKWELQDAGVMDRTHLRFFVKKTAIELMTCSGLYLHGIQPTGLGRGRKARTINTFTGGLFEQFLALQYVVRVGKKALAMSH
jgi:2-polyprenyl-3-methyl-5-hydroxy-6-metoxy-1,4-benzoquinol methylase